MPESVKKTVYAYATYKKEGSAYAIEIIETNPCTDSSIGNCKRLVTLEHAKNIITNIVKSYTDQNNSNRAFKILLGSIGQTANKKGGYQMKIKYV